MEIDARDLAVKWIENSEDPCVEDQLYALISSDPTNAFQFILEALKLSSSSRELEDLAAGPLEDFLVKNGNLFIPKIENEAKRSSEFKQLLGGVWKNRMNDSVWNRVVKARGKAW